VTNTKVSKILVGVDGSKESADAANYAIAIAKKEDSELIAITTLQLPSFYGWAAIEAPKEWNEKNKQEIQRFLDQISDSAKENNVKIKTEIVESPMSVEGSIVDHAEKEGVDLIVIGTRGRTGFTKRLLASVALGVVTHAHCPILVIK
jgi:nucleotide-binding universal stress UspA family protein